MSTVTLRSLEFIIPMYTPVKISILDYNDDVIYSHDFEWPSIGPLYNHELIDLRPGFDPSTGRYLIIKLRQNV